MSNKADITMYGEQELSLNILNTEYLYRQFLRCEDSADLEELCSDFEYTSEQFEELESDLKDELAEG